MRNSSISFCLSSAKTDLWTWKVLYLTVLPNRPIKKESTVSFLFSNLYQFLKNARVKILLEKIYGLSSLREDTVAIRNRCINMMRENMTIPFTYIGSVPCIGGKIAGVQIISGTASINQKGKTIYVHDEQGQITETLINIGALLETKNAHLRDIVLTASYCKNL